MLPVRKIIEVTVDAEGSIQIEQFDPVEDMTIDIITMPYQDVPWLIDQLLKVTMERKLVLDSNLKPKPN